MNTQTYTVVVSLVSLDEQGDVVERLYDIRMDRQCTYAAADRYACSAIEFIEESMAFNDEPYRPGVEVDDE